MPVTSVVTMEALEQVLEQTAGHEVLEAGRALQAAGRVTRAGPAYLGVSGTVQDDRAERRCRRFWCGAICGLTPRTGSPPGPGGGWT